jgi:hypothetical protein
MLIHHSPFERITAITDIFMGLIAAYAAVYLSQFPGLKPAVWAWSFGLLSFLSILGAVAHGFEMDQKVNNRFWLFINLALGLALGLFVVGALIDLSGEMLARKSLPVMLAVGLGFFLFTIWKPGTFMTFIAYEMVAMLFALGAYVYLFITSPLAGTGWMLAGVSVTILAAIVQATGKVGKGIFWYIDNNGMFHLIQMVGLLLLLTGVGM